MIEKTLISLREKGNNQSLVLLCLAFSALIIIGVIVPVLSWFVFFAAAVYIIFGKSDENKYVFILYLFPFAPVFKYSVGAISFSTVLLFLLLIISLFKKRLDTNFLILFIIFAVMCAVGIGNGVGYVIKHICIPLYLYFLFSPRFKIDKYIFAKLYVLSVLLVSVLGYFKDYIPNFSSYVMNKDLRIDVGVYTTRFTGLWGDPNYYAVNILLALSLVIILHIEKKLNPVLCYISYVLLIIFGALTNSKSFLLVLAILAVLSVIAFIKGRRYGTAIFMAISVTVIAVLSLSGAISVFTTILNRFSQVKSLTEFTTSRSDIWLSYFNFFNQNIYVWLIGNGFGCELLNGCATHNTYIEFIYNFGIIGTFFWFKTVFYRTRFYRKSFSIVNILPLVTIVLSYLSLSELKYYDLVFHIALVLMFILKTEDRKDGIDQCRMYRI